MTKKMFWSLFGVSMFALGLSSTALADEPPPSGVHIRNLTYGGSGCPAGTTAVDIAPDRKAFTLIFDDFIASVGPNVPLTDSRKNCQVNLTLFVPNGFTYAVYAVDYRGFANIARGSRGMQKATYYFQGQAPQASTWRSFMGRYNADWHLRDEVEAASLVWSPCGVLRSLNINAQLRLERGSAPVSPGSFMTMDSEDGSIHQIYHLRFRRCNQ